LRKNIPTDLILQDELVTQTIMNNSEDTIYFKNLDSKFILNSKAHANQFHEKDVKDMVGKDDFDYFPDEFAQAARDDEKTIIETGRPILGRIEKWNKPDGDIVWFQAYKYPLYDKEGNIIGTWGTSRNITPLKRAEEELIRLNRELQEANQRLEILSTRDSLSGLYNHRHFFDSLNVQKNIELRQKDRGISSEFSVLLVDIDYFKSINDTYGHQAGDFVIKTLSNLLTQSTRLVDTCYRIGGDEFAIILMNTDVKNARKVADKLRISIEKHEFNTNDMNLKITISIGTASSNEAETVKELISLADSRLYNAKELGRNQIK
jgi:diguanylate cyclase (GGDEF)-like protein/PAS domain S-box-containing protein